MYKIFEAPSVELEKLEAVWLQLSNSICNIKCKHCFLNIKQEIKKKNFLDINKIVDVLKKIDKINLKTIYLTGGEPFLHPKFNDILELCLRYANVIIYTNGTFFNEKRIKTIDKLSEKFNNRVGFFVSLDHFMQGKHDEYRGNNVFKKVLNGLNYLEKYNFNVRIMCTNIKNENEEYLKNGFDELFKQHNLKLTKNDVTIIPLLKIGEYAKHYDVEQNENNIEFSDIENINENILDCKNSRVISSDGIFSCPALINDPRGKLGSNINDISQKVYLETETCLKCLKCSHKMFGL